LIKTCFPTLVPWHRKQLSYWLTAGLTTVTPSMALTPVTFVCGGRTVGGKDNVVD
jgi:hypothetical protein